MVEPTYEPVDPASIMVPGDDDGTDPVAAALGMKPPVPTTDVDELTGRTAVKVFGRSRYGGQEWNGGRLHVHIVGLTADEKAAANLFDPLVVLHDGAVSYEQARAWVELLGYQVLPDLGRGHNTIAGDKPGHGVRLTTDTPYTESQWQTITSVVPEEHISVVYRDKVGLRPEEDHSNRLNWNAWFVHGEGGLRIRTPLGGGTFNNCTTSWRVANGFGPFLVTAGHCAALGAQMHDTNAAGNGWNFSDFMRNRVVTTESDSGVISTASIVTYPRVHMQTTHRTVVSRYSNGNPSRNNCGTESGGGGLWGSGAQSNNDFAGCLQEANDIVDGLLLYCMDRVGLAGGDSGGPYYKILPDGTLHALGIHRRRTVDNRPCFTHIWFMIRDQNVAMDYS